MKIGPVGLDLIKRYEGFSAKAYLDPVGVWTIGYGTTHGAGVNVYNGMTCTVAQATEWLEAYVNRDVVPAIAAAQQARLKSHGWRTSFNENQVDALCSFGYNLGPGVFLPGSTVGYHIRAGYTKRRIASDLLLYDHAGGQVLPGLLARRQAERNLFLTPMRKRPR